MHPSVKETICVTADTCGRKASTIVMTRNVTTEGCLHHSLFKDGVLKPTRAKMILENPTASALVANHDNVPMMYAATSESIPYRTSLRKRAHNERQFTARWKMLAWKKWCDRATHQQSICRNCGHPKRRCAVRRIPAIPILALFPSICRCYQFVAEPDLLRDYP